MKKPRLKSEYPPGQLEHVRAVCIEIAHAIGPLMDELVIVGGFVPSLLPTDVEPGSQDDHIGTLDLDLGLEVGVEEPDKYQKISAQLEAAKFERFVDKEGRRSDYRWTYPIAGLATLTVDFVVGSRESNKGWRPEVRFAFADRLRCTITGKTFAGEETSVDVWVCGPAAFVLLKTQAFEDREAPKDAYDLHFVLSHYRAGLDEIVSKMQPLLNDTRADELLGTLREAFKSESDSGPKRLAEFVGNPDNAAIKADVVGLVRFFLYKLGIK